MNPIITIIKESLALPLLLACIATLITTPFVMKWAWKNDLIDDPKKRKHPALVHKNTTPRAGGLALFIGIVTVSLLFLPLNKEFLGILLGATVVVIVGVLDDKYDIHPLIRLITNFFAAAIVVASGIGINYITSPFGGVLRLDTIQIPIQLFGSHTIVPLADTFAILWIAWTMNMLNWSKGVDGQMPLIVIVGAITIGLLSLRFVSYEPQQLEVAKLAFIVAGATTGFLFFNWHPAKIFPGYSATILGFILAVLAIITGAKVATALLVLGVPMVDAIFTIVRRIYHKKPPYVGDKGHLHHRLLEIGWSHQKISLFYFILCAILGTFALNLSSEQKLFAMIVVGVIFAGGIIWLTFSLGFSNLSGPANGQKT